MNSQACDPNLHPSHLLSQQQRSAPSDLPLGDVQTPCFLMDLRLLEDHGRYLKAIQEKAQIHILLAQKAYSYWPSYPLLSSYLAGTTASGLYEAKLGFEHMKGDVHCFCPAYKREDFAELYHVTSHLILNSASQLDLYRSWLKNEGAQLDPNRAPKIGLRLNPEVSTAEVALYDPSAKGSRLGITPKVFDQQGLLERLKDPSGDPRGDVSGFHIHALCEQGAEDFEKLYRGACAVFDELFKRADWMNFGGGQHFTHRDYNLPLFLKLCQEIHSSYPQAQIFFEPGEAIVLDCGWLISEVLDVVENEGKIAILDASAECHMPDVLEMPYRPRAFLYAENEGKIPETCAEEEGPNVYTLAGATCLAGDHIGRYAFDQELKIGDRIVFCDMALYSFVKSNHFNGMPHPQLAHFDGTKVHVSRMFRYEDFKAHMG